MPMYSLLVRTSEGEEDRRVLGFYRDEAATAYARRIRAGAHVEVWRDQELVTCIDRGQKGAA